VLFFLRLIGIVVAEAAYFLGIRKKVTLDNLRKAYPELLRKDRQKIALKTYNNLGIVFAEMLYLRFADRKNIAKHIRAINPDLFQNSLAQNKGLIIVAAHFANWEWLAHGFAIVLEKNLSIIQKNIQTSFTEQFLKKMRMRAGNELINSADIRKMYRTLQNGGRIGLLADQAAPGESTRVLFFGREVPTFEGPARLALRTRAPMIFTECRREENGDYSIRFYPIPFDDLSGDSPENIHELTFRHTHLLEECIRRHPDQWLWQHRRWKYV
jgi:KDO2-lipid IV(A) lauroyltransferase